jgi:hypothetical protein
MQKNLKIFTQSALHFFGLAENPLVSAYRNRASDYENMVSDWRNVGNDINNAYETCTKEIR